MKGIIKKLNDKGFGFIAIEGRKDIFFHANDCVAGNFKDLQEGMTVSFETAESDKGPKAVKVVVEDGMDMNGANNNDGFADQDEEEAA